MNKPKSNMSLADAVGLSLMLFVVVVSFLLLFGCASSQQAITRTPLWVYKPDIEITVDGKTFEGMGVTKMDGHKVIKIRSKARMDMLKISSCHREFTVEKVDYSEGWFGIGGSSAKTFTYEFDATQIEKEDFCPLYIEALEKSGERGDQSVIAAWGYLAFRTGEALPSKMDCNGIAWTFAGVSVCASRAGFEQAIRFDRPVTFKANNACRVSIKSDREFRVRTDVSQPDKGVGFCLMTFKDGKDTHRLVLHGWDEALVRSQ